MLCHVPVPSLVSDCQSCQGNVVALLNLPTDVVCVSQPRPCGPSGPARGRMLHSRPWHGRARASILVTGYRSDAKAVCILGMHRGGTSAVTGVVHELGAFLGPSAHLMAPRADNPVGFFEHQLLTNLNDELLHALGGTWYAPPPLDEGWERAPHLDGIRVRARQRLHDDFGDASLWVWKDPRTCLTLPFWRSLLPKTKYVVCVRNPLDVARSLLARDGLEETKGIDLWLRHAVAALADATEMPLLVSYDDLVNDPSAEVARMAAFLELDVPPGNLARAQAQLADNAALRHHHTTFADQCASPAASFAAVALYAVLQRSVALQRAGALRFEDLVEVTGPLARRAARAHLDERDAEGRSLRLAAVDAHAAALVGALEARAAELGRARGDVTALTDRLGETTAAAARLGALLLAQKAEAAARFSARNAEVDALLLARDAEAAAQLSLHDAEAAARSASHEGEVAALRTAHEVDVTALRTAHGAEVVALRTSYDVEVTALRTAHDVDVASLQAQIAADAATTTGLRLAVRGAQTELSTAATEMGRLNALLLHLQTPAGIVKLALRGLLPSGVHRRLRTCVEWARGRPSAP